LNVDLIVRCAILLALKYVFEKIGSTFKDVFLFFILRWIVFFSHLARFGKPDALLYTFKEGFPYAFEVRINRHALVVNLCNSEISFPIGITVLKNKLVD